MPILDTPAGAPPLLAQHGSSLTGLPSDVWPLIWRYSSRASREALRSTCRALRAIADSKLAVLEVLPTSEWLREVELKREDRLLAKFSNVEALYLRPASARDFIRRVELSTAFAVLGPLPSLHRLHLSGWPSQQHLDIYGALASWCPNLEDLVLEGLTPSSLHRLSQLPHLRRLSLRHTAPHQQHIIMRGCPDVRTLTQLSCLQLTGVVPNASTAAALAALTGLRRLNLDLLHDGYDKAMQVLDLRSHTCLTRLALRACSAAAAASRNGCHSLPCPSALRATLQRLPASLVALAVEVGPWRPQHGGQWAPPPPLPPAPPAPLAPMDVDAAAAAADRVGPAWQGAASLSHNPGSQATGAGARAGAGGVSCAPLLRELRCPADLLLCLRDVGLCVYRLEALALAPVQQQYGRELYGWNDGWGCVYDSGAEAEDGGAGPAEGLSAGRSLGQGRGHWDGGRAEAEGEERLLRRLVAAAAEQGRAGDAAACASSWDAAAALQALPQGEQGVGGAETEGMQRLVAAEGYYSQPLLQRLRHLQVDARLSRNPESFLLSLPRTPPPHSPRSSPSAPLMYLHLNLHLDRELNPVALTEWLIHTSAHTLRHLSLRGLRPAALRRPVEQLAFVACLAQLPALRVLCLQPLYDMLGALCMLGGHPALRVLRLEGVVEEGERGDERPLRGRLVQLMLALGGGACGVGRLAEGGSGGVEEGPWCKEESARGGRGHGVGSGPWQEIEGTWGQKAGGRDAEDEKGGSSVGSGAEDVVDEGEAGVAGLGVTGMGPLRSCDLVRGKPARWLAAAVQAGQELRRGWLHGRGLHGGVEKGRVWVSGHRVVLVVPQLQQFEVVELNREVEAGTGGMCMCELRR